MFRVVFAETEYNVAAFIKQSLTSQRYPNFLQTYLIFLVTQHYMNSIPALRLSMPLYVGNKATFGKYVNRKLKNALSEILDRLFVVRLREREGMPT